jgi:putative transposase
VQAALAAEPGCKRDSNGASLPVPALVEFQGGITAPNGGGSRFNVTAHPTAEWTGQQLREAFPFAPLPRYLLRDRDAIFGNHFREQVRDMSICEVLSAPRSPWQRGCVERVIGSIRRECLDHVIVFQENSLRRTLNSYFDYYHRSRTHLSLGKDSPEPRAIQPPEMGSVVALPQVGGLHHRYERRAA